MQTLRPPVLSQAASSQAVLPGITVWHNAVWRCWAALTALSLAAGFAWRFTGNAPPVGVALDAAGLALAVSAVWLVPAWENLLQVARPFQRWSWRSLNLLPDLMLQAIVAALVLACAPLGLLLAYRAGDAVARVETAENIVFRVPLSAAVLATLLLMGISFVLLSLGLLTLLRGLAKPGLGLLLWLGTLLALHASLFQVQLWAGQKYTLGQFLSWLMELLTRTVIDPSHSFYLTELLSHVLGFPFVAMVIALAVLMLSSSFARQPAPVLQPALIPVTAVLAAALCVAFQASAWTRDATRRYPGDWNDVLAVGLLVLLLGHWLLAWEKRQCADWRSLGSELLWAWWTMGACAACTLPYIYSGQGDQLEVLRGLLAALVIGSPALLLIRRLGAWRNAANWTGALLLILVLIALAVPPSAVHPLLMKGIAQTLTLALQQPEQAPQAYWVFGAMAVLSCLLWPWRRSTPLKKPSVPAKI